MLRERILITAKTYPTLSKKYGETVCTAGLREDGSWVRIYPIPFRRLDEKQQYEKYEWIEGDFVRNTSDHRYETLRPTDVNKIIVTGKMEPSNGWRERKALVLGKARVETKLTPLCEAIKNTPETAVSLAVFKPARLLGFDWESDEREWDKERMAEMRDKARQSEFDFAEADAWRLTFETINKLPYRFFYKFEDADKRVIRLQLLDWECGQLFWNCFRCTNKKLGLAEREKEALAKVKQRYWDEFSQKELCFFIGTLQQFHGYSPNPWNIIGVFYPPYVNQLELPGF
ncbi:hypothetical protein Ga0100231_002130 [Opitutaceae bacterium TAV4]|nr:hypothetical protein Ga0100231_002130 [Opitutaceae bacterium TAV4]RRK01760.1 hypothetical protein Ga0100230_000325 [Opitutaceae bacterium TAV3]